MRIVVLSTVYPTKNAPVGTTPVVHYFAREWVKLGHKVLVFHTLPRYPFFVYWVCRLFEKRLVSRLGQPVPVQKPVTYHEFIDGVEVYHHSIFTTKRNARFPQKRISSLYNTIMEEMGTMIPDLLIGHWFNPQLDLICLLKRHFPQAKASLVFHHISKDLCKFYNGEFYSMLKTLDIVGFRNKPARESFISKYGNLKNTFIASSGVDVSFIRNASAKNFDKEINSFIYVGMLIQRKHPKELVTALATSYGEKNFCVTFVGDGDERGAIQEEYKKHNCTGKLLFTGRIDREKIIDYLRKADVFVMISDHETFGLVYLEAMAMGCITIASRGAGVDGIITHGKNGFLCEQGNADELADIISSIRKMSHEKLCAISQMAVETAKSYSDSNVALRYLEDVMKS